MVIPLADACAQPDAVVVKFLDAIVADVAVAGSWWPENITCLAIFEFEQAVLLIIHRVEENPA